MYGLEQIHVIPVARRLFRSLYHPNFRIFFLGQATSFLGSWIQSTAQAWLLYRLTNSAFVLGMLGFMTFIPVFIFSLFGGVVADIFPKRVLLKITQFTMLLQALTLAILTVSGTIKPFHILVLSFVLGLIMAFDIPIRQAFIKEMAGPDDLPNAIALNSAAFNGARLIGPAMAGFIVGLLNEGICFFLNAFTFLIVLISLFIMHFPKSENNNSKVKWRDFLKEGVGYALKEKRVKATLCMVMVLSFFGFPFIGFMPIMATNLGSKAEGYGILMGSIGLGATCGALALAMRKKMGGMGHLIGYTAIVFGISLMLFAIVKSFLLAIVALSIVGFSMIMAMAACNTFLQVTVPDNLRGRVMSLYSMLFGGIVPFGSLITGAVAEWTGVPLAIFFSGFCTLLSAIIFLLLIPILKR